MVHISHKEIFVTSGSALFKNNSGFPYYAVVVRGLTLALGITAVLLLLLLLDKLRYLGLCLESTT